MKPLIVLSLAQFVLLGWIAVAVTAAPITEPLALQPAAGESVASSPAGLPEAALLIGPDTCPPTLPAATQNLERIREVVREEIVAALAVSADPSGTGRQPDIAPLRSAEDTFLRESLELEIQHYVERGDIDPAEMRVLQQEIARLPGVDRRELLVRLVQALNSGELKGQL